MRRSIEAALVLCCSGGFLIAVELIGYTSSKSRDMLESSMSSSLPPSSAAVGRASYSVVILVSFWFWGLEEARGGNMAAEEDVSPLPIAIALFLIGLIVN